MVVNVTLFQDVKCSRTLDCNLYVLFSQLKPYGSTESGQNVRKVKSSYRYVSALNDKNVCRVSAGVVLIVILKKNKDFH